MGFGFGWIVSKVVMRVFRRFDRTKLDHAFKWLQIVAGAGVAFMHGAQDGARKFMGIFILAIAGHRYRPGGPDGAAYLVDGVLRAQHGPRF